MMTGVEGFWESPVELAGTGHLVKKLSETRNLITGHEGRSRSVRFPSAPGLGRRGR